MSISRSHARNRQCAWREIEVLEDRYGTRSTIVTSQLDPKRWHDHIADPTHADAICDRLVHNAHRIALMGPSKRKEPTSTK